MVGAVRFEISPQDSKGDALEVDEKERQPGDTRVDARPVVLTERATIEEKAAFIEGFAKVSTQQQQTLLKLAFDHVTPECRDILLRYIEAVHAL